MKKITSICLMLILLLTMTATTAVADEVYSNLYCTIENIFYEDEFEDFKERLADIGSTYGVEAVVMLEADLGEGANSKDHLINYYDSGVNDGAFNKDGISLIFNRGGGRYAFYAAGAMDGLVTADDFQTLWDAFATGDTYYEGAIYYVDALIALIAGLPEPPADDVPPVATEPPVDDTAPDSPEAPVELYFFRDEITSMTNEQRLSIDLALEDIYVNYGISAVILYVKSTDNDGLLNYSGKFYNEGMREGYLDEAGVIFVLSEGDAEWAIYFNGRAKEIFDLSDVDKLFSKYDDAETYYGGFMDYIDAVSQHLENRGVQPIPADRQLPRLVDDANLFTAEQEATLLARLDEISERQRCDVVIVTVASIGRKSPTAFADDYYDYNGYGHGDNDDGILFLLSMEERDWAISTYSFGLTAFTDAGQAYIFNAIKSDLGSDRYYDAFDKYVTLCDEFLTAARNGDPIDTHNLPKTSVDKVMSVIGWIFMLGICFLVSHFIMKSLKRSSARPLSTKQTAHGYTVEGSLIVTRSEDEFLHKNVSQTVRVSTTSSGGGGGSSSHSSSSGRSHGGSSGKF